nr:MAG TPA: hypothetical protein [Caudoviricetes sp.]
MPTLRTLLTLSCTRSSLQEQFPKIFQFRLPNITLFFL